MVGASAIFARNKNFPPFTIRNAKNSASNPLNKAAIVLFALRDVKYCPDPTTQNHNYCQKHFSGLMLY